MVKNHIIKTRKIKEQNVVIKYCSFNARNHEQVEKGAKGLLQKDSAMIGQELCKLLGLNFDKIVEERKKHQKENLKFFIGEIKKIPEIHSKL